MTRTNPPSVERSSHVEAERLADAQARRVEQLEQGPVAQAAVVIGFVGIVAARGHEQAVGLLDREGLRQQA